MKIPTELRIFIQEKECLFNKYINSYLAGDIKNLTIKEEYVMLERLKEQREVYCSELEVLKQTDLEVAKNERFNLLKEQVAKEVEAEHDAKLAAVELKIAHYDFVIADEEAKEIAKLNETINDETFTETAVENLEG